MDETMLKAMTDGIVEALDPEEVFLFGSYAKGTEHPNSDVDFLVVMSESEDNRKYRRSLTGRAYRRLAQFPVSKDILLYSRGEFEHWRNVPGHIISTSVREGRRLYAKG